MHVCLLSSYRAPGSVLGIRMGKREPCSHGICIPEGEKIIHKQASPRRFQKVMASLVETR